LREEKFPEGDKKKVPDQSWFGPGPAKKGNRDGKRGNKGGGDHRGLDVRGRRKTEAGTGAASQELKVKRPWKRNESSQGETRIRTRATSKPEFLHHPRGEKGGRKTSMQGIRDLRKKNS